jgi:hypothetical protein
MRKKRPARWWQLTDEPPNPTFLRWVRVVILIVWAAVLVVGIPDTVSEARSILAFPPSEIRRAALETLVIESIVKLVAMPFVVLAVFGFGVFPRNVVNVWSTGGPPFVPLWRSVKNRRSARKRTAVRKPEADSAPQEHEGPDSR